MKTIGLIGGMSWNSTNEYYRILNEAINQRLGGYHSAKIVMYSVDFAETYELKEEGKRDELVRLLIDAARRVEKGDADFLVMCTNTYHKYADEISRGINIPVLHIADAAAERILANGVKKVGLLGTRQTMEEDFYKGRLAEKHGLEVLVPEEPDRKLVDDVIFDELCFGKTPEKSKVEYRRIVNGLVEQGAEGIILGCTEIHMIVKPDDSPVPIFDTTRIHALKAVEMAIGK